MSNVQPQMVVASGQESHIKQDLTISPDDYMRDRVIYKMNVYERLGKHHRVYYLGISLVAIILAAAVPVLINLQVDSIISTIISLIVTILISTEKLFHFREHWRNYDEMAAFLRSEQVKFQTRSGEYQPKDMDNDKAFHLFVARIERAISNERNETIEMRTSENSAT